MRATSDAGTEASVLTTEAGQRLLDAVAEVATPGPADLERGRRTLPAEMVASAVRLVASRRRGASKFTRADRMWFDSTGLEQATAEPVARHKARRFPGGVVVDLCAGIGGDTLALAAQAPVLAVDLDHGMCRRVRWNAEVYEVAERVAPIRARAEDFPIPRAAWVHIDPDRRARSVGRARHLRDYVPGLGFLQTLPRRARGGAIKLSPASDFATHFGTSEQEIELVSLRGECKEVTVWFGELATCGRRATVLPSNATWTDRDGPGEGAIGTGPLLDWIFDPDAALIRAALLDSFAAAHGLRRCASGVDFLTGPSPLGSPFVTGFVVQEILPFDLKMLRRIVADRRLGPLEIKPRGLDVHPESLRARLRPPGPNPATLLLIGGRGRARAILARRG